MPQGSPAGQDADLALTETQNWAAHSHRVLYDAVHNANDPGRVGELADEWKRLSQEIEDATGRMADRLKATESGWQGDAADAARAAIQQLADWNVDAGKTAGAMAERISEQGRIMETAKTEMPEPVDMSGAEQAQVNLRLAMAFANNDLESFTRATEDVQAQQARSSSAHQQAIDVMTRMETESRAVDGDTPRFAPPPNPIQDEESPQHKASAQERADAPPVPEAKAGPAETKPSAVETQKINTLPAGAPGGQGPGAPPLAGQTPAAGLGGQVPPALSSPQGTGPAGFDAQTRSLKPPNLNAPNPADAPTRSFRPPNLNAPNPADAPTRSFRPPNLNVPDSPQQNVPQFKPSSTNPQNAGPYSPSGQQPGGEDRFHQPRPFQSPDGVPFAGPNAPQRIGQPGPGDSRNRWGGQIPPPIPGTGDGAGAGFSGPGAGGSGAGTGGASFSGPGGVGGPGGHGGNLAPGGVAGTGGVGAGGGAGPGRGGEAGAPGQPGASGMASGSPGMMSGAMGQQRGQGGEEDKERAAKYVEGGPIVEVPGADLPPPVIGEGKRKKNQDQG
jgi:hypothetical protein